ncbi:MAG: superoxide dismutase family protein [Novosphingobium sp.]|nr:superoxide dismutase family protein [Novosphingobium sp.]
MMKKSGFLAFTALLAIAPIEAVIADHHAVPAAASPAKVLGSDGAEIGAAIFEQTPGGVLISIAARNLPPGEHGFHIHEKGVCDPAAGFKTAGGHFSPRGRQHGLMVAAGSHAGDMPNQMVASDGVMRVAVLNTNVTLETGVDSLVDADGSALVIHAGADDYRSQPTGAAGGRLACVVIRPPMAK